MLRNELKAGRSGGLGETWTARRGDEGVWFLGME